MGLAKRGVDEEEEGMVRGGGVGIEKGRSKKERGGPRTGVERA